MRRYETIIITDPDLTADQRAPVFQRVQDVIEQNDGYLAFTDEWGARKLAYEIKKKERGYYTRFDFCGTGPVVDEIERFFRIDDRVLKYMTILLDEAADIEKIKEEVAAAQSKVEVSQERADAAEDQSPAEQTDAAEAQKTESEIDEAEAAEKQKPESKINEAEATEQQKPESETNDAEAAPTEAKEETK